MNNIFYIAWGDDGVKVTNIGDSDGFGNDEGFDDFLAMSAPPKVS